MQVKGEDSLPFRLIKLGGIIVSTVFHLLNLVLLLESKWDKLQKVLLLIGPILLWSFTLYLLLKKKTIGQNFGTPHEVPAYPIRTRQFALAGLILIPALFLGWTYYESLPAVNVIVVLADFEGPDPQSYRVTEMLLANLRDIAKKHPQIEVFPLGRPISEQEGSSLALQEGRQRKASAVIWGWYGKTGEKVLLTSHFEVIKPLKGSFPSTEMSLFLRRPI
jgi:hypothetical protein